MLRFKTVKSITNLDCTHCWKDIYFEDHFIQYEGYKKLNFCSMSCFVSFLEGREDFVFAKLEQQEFEVGAE